MKIKITYALWAVLFIICTCLGVVNGAAGFGKALLTLSSLIFFIPGALLLYWGQHKQVRIICLCSLGATLVLLVANFFSVLASETVGNALHTILVILSTPMFCSQYWVLSMFLWACLLMVTFLKPKKVS